MERVYLFTRFERLWHWAQAVLIIGMLVTGFEIHGTYKLLGFEPAVRLHTMAAWALIVLWLFTLFWHVTTGEWRQYSPTTSKIGAMMKFYASGIFRGEEHPAQNELLKSPLLQLLGQLSGPGGFDADNCVHGRAIGYHEGALQRSGKA